MLAEHWLFVKVSYIFLWVAMINQHIVHRASTFFFPGEEETTQCILIFEYPVALVDYASWHSSM